MGTGPHDLLESIGLDETIASRDPHQTIRSENWGAGMRPRSPDALSQIRVYERSEAAPENAEIILGSELGRGGMGVVRTAEQVPLGREVAVKRLKAKASEAQKRALAKEAMITGALEHPNVTPVHLLAMDDDARPLLIMKQVQGVPWSRMLDDPKHEAWLRVVGDRLEWNLQVLLQVANAVSFAHSRRIIHRDLKPENVMIGAFGEVYLLDWGVALTFDETAAARAETRGLKIVGTPAFMAPEMIDAERGEVDPRTDVFQLGGLLYCLLTSQPPNLADSLVATLARALHRTELPFPDRAPPPLRQIAARALSSRQEDRFESAEAFRRAVMDYLQTRGALSICAQATNKLQRLKAGHESPVEIYRRFGACRFGFEEALRLTPQLSAAEEGVKDALEFMFRFEIERRNAEGAEVHLEELRALKLAQPRLEALDASLSTLRAEDEKTQAELQRLKGLEQDLNVDIEGKKRSAVVLIFSACFVLFGALLAERVEVLPPHPTLWARMVVVIGFALIGWFGRTTILTNTATRRLGLAALVLSVALLLNRILALMIDVSVDEVLIFDQLVAATGLGIMTAAIDRKLIFATLVMTIGACVSAAYPAHSAAAFATSMSLTMGCLVLAWRYGPKSSPQEKTAR